MTAKHTTLTSGALVGAVLVGTLLAACTDPQKTTADFFNGSAVSSALTQAQNSWIAAKGQNLHQTGETTLKSVEQLKTDLTNNPKTRSNA